MRAVLRQGLKETSILNPSNEVEYDEKQDKGILGTKGAFLPH
jgi:hypothetical protein